MRSRTIPVLAPVAALALAVGGCAQSQTHSEAMTPTVSAAPVTAAETQAPAGPVQADRVTMVVRGLSCPFCSSNLERTISKLPGILDVSVDLAKGQAEVSLVGKDRPTYEQLAEAVHDSGFTFAGFAEAGAEAQP